MIRYLVFIVAVALTTAGRPAAQPELPLSVMVREVASPAGIGTGEPNLTRGLDGFLYMSWIQKNPDTTHTLFVAKFDSAGFEPARPVATGRGWFVNWADFPALAVGPGGRMLASWLQKNGGDTYAYGVRLAFSSDGGRRWSAPFIPHEDKTETEHGFVSIVAHPEGGFDAIWLDGREMIKPDGPMTLRTAHIDGDGKLESETLLDGRVCDCCQTALARGANGALVAAYRDRSDAEIRDIGLVRRQGGRWSEPMSVHADNWKIAGCPVNGPALDALGQTVVAAWFTMGADDSARVYAAFSRDGGGAFAAPLRLDQGKPLGRVDVALLDEERAAVLWLQPTGGQTKIMVRVVTADGQMRVPTTVAETSADRESGFPRMAFDGSRLIVAWTDPAAGPRVRTMELRLE